MKLATFKRKEFIAGLLAGVLVTWLGYSAYRFWMAPFLPAAFSDLLFAIVPGPLQAQAIKLLGSGAKLLSFYLFIVAQIVAFEWAGLRVVQTPRGVALSSPIQRYLQPWLKIAIIILGLLLLLSLTGMSINWSWEALVAVAVGTAALYVALVKCFDLLLRVSFAKSSEPLDERDSRYTRRDLLATLVSTAGAALMWPLLAHDLSGQGSTSSDPLKSSAQMILPPPSRFDSIPGLPSRVTPTGQFYYVSKNLLPHQASVWGPLRIEGLVEHTLTLSLLELQTLPAIEHFVTLVCVDYEPNNPSTNDLISTALWQGVSLQTLIAQAGVRPEATTIELYATDGYSTAIPLQLILENPAMLLAYRMNGQPLDARHGLPIRLISPGLYGFKNIKHLNQIVLSKGEYSGYWERRGWAQQAPVKLLSKVTTPEAGSRLERDMPVWIAGVAFAGKDGISAVEVSVDGGQRWEPAELEAPLSPFSWRRWAYRWVPSQTGGFVFIVRATDGHGRLQDYVETSAFPAGATGYHSVPVQVN